MGRGAGARKRVRTGASASSAATPSDSAPLVRSEPLPEPAVDATGELKRAPAAWWQWDAVQAYQAADEHRKALLKPLRQRDTLQRDLRTATSEVERAKAVMRHFALADARLLVALRHGTSPKQLEVLRSSSRLIADLATRSLSTLGLRPGEVVEHEVSGRFQEFLERWRLETQPPLDAPLALDARGHGLDAPLALPDPGPLPV